MLHTPIISLAVLPAGMTDFSYEGKVLPIRMIGLPVQDRAIYPDFESQNFIVGPHMGMKKAHAGIGLSIGKNGIAVFQWSYQSLTALISHPLSITDHWISFKLVFTDRTPVLYVDGKRTAAGRKSNKLAVLPSGMIGGSLWEEFNGEWKDLCLRNLSPGSSAEPIISLNQKPVVSEIETDAADGMNSNRKAAEIAIKVNSRDLEGNSHEAAIAEKPESEDGPGDNVNHEKLNTETDKRNAVIPEREEDSKFENKNEGYKGQQEGNKQLTSIEQKRLARLSRKKRFLEARTVKCLKKKHVWRKKQDE